jgi:hypothetical protein
MCFDTAVGPVNYIEFKRNYLATPCGNHRIKNDNKSTGQNCIDQPNGLLSPRTLSNTILHRKTISCFRIIPLYDCLSTENHWTSERFRL